MEKEDYLMKLAEFYDSLEKYFPPENKCNHCGLCCHDPCRNVVHRLEYELIDAYTSENYGENPVDFEVLNDESMDKRDLFGAWRCPYYNDEYRCLIYEVRPFACRVFGHFPVQPIPFEECSFKDDPVFDSPEELPFAQEYTEFKNMLKDYSPDFGYFFPRILQEMADHRRAELKSAEKEETT